MTKVLIDAHMLGQQEGGNETYVAGLLKGLCSLPSNEFTITAIYSPTYYPEQTTSAPVHSFRFQSSSSVRRVFVDTPSICKSWNADLLHVTYNTSPFLQTPCVVSVHDIIFRLYPQYFSPRVRVLLSTLMPLSMLRAKAVFTISEASKEDILNYYPFVRNKIIVTPLAAGPIVDLQPDISSVQKYTNNCDFILTVGNVQPRKNIVGLVQAYIMLRERKITTAKLIIVGRAQWQGSEIQKLACKSEYNHDIIFTGYLDDASVAALYKACRVFVYPSLYEGFGLPVLEAMALGAPVITSNLSSLPEVAGDAALFVDSRSHQQLADAMERVLTVQDLSENLSRRGLLQAARFSWQQTAVATLEGYRWALGTH
jgi:glycosyltransferase involved in cell wall biosynthesis